MRAWLAARLDRDAHVVHRLWSIRVALFWGAVCGFYAAWPAFESVVPPALFAAASVVMCMAIAGARVLRQPGLD